MKKWQKVSIIVVIALFTLNIVKNIVAKVVVASSASHVLGARVDIDSLSIGTFKQGVRIKGLRVHNPKGFPEGVLIDIRKIGVQYSLGSILFKRKLLLPKITLDLKEMVVIRNKEGRLNVDALKVSQQKQQPAKKKKPAKKMPMVINELHLNLGRVVVKDYSKAEKPVILAYDIGVKDRVHKNINGSSHLALLVMLDAMGPTGLKGAAIYSAASLVGAGFLPAGIAAAFIGSDKSVSEYRVGTGRSFDEALKLIQNIGEIIEENKEAYSIKAKVYDSDVTMEFKKGKKGGTEITIKARKFMLPKAEVAAGIMYQLEEILK